MYALMEQHLDVIVDCEVVDRRETGGVSTNMEVLERIVGKITVSEFVSDASSAVISLVRKMKGLYDKQHFDFCFIITDNIFSPIVTY